MGVPAPTELVAAVRTANQFLTYATATPLQPGIVVGARTPDEYFPELRTSRDGAACCATGWPGRLRDLCPDGTYFASADFRPFGFDDDVSSAGTSRERGVVAAPQRRLLPRPGAGQGPRAVRVLQARRRPHRGGLEVGEGVRVAVVQTNRGLGEPRRPRRARAEPRWRRRGRARARRPRRDVRGRFHEGEGNRPAAGRPAYRLVGRADGARRRVGWPAFRARPAAASASQQFVLAGPDGSAGPYAKSHPFTFAGEDRVYSGGDRVETVYVDGVRVSPSVCYDLRFANPFWAQARRHRSLRHRRQLAGQAARALAHSPPRPRDREPVVRRRRQPGRRRQRTPLRRRLPRRRPVRPGRGRRRRHQGA